MNSAKPRVAVHKFSSCDGCLIPGFNMTKKSPEQECSGLWED